MSPSTTITSNRPHVAFWLVAAAYLYVFPHQPRLNNPNENVRFYMTAAIVEEGVYSIDTLRDRWGWVNDASVREGHYYSVKAPGSSLLAIPGYALYRALGRPFERQEALWFCRLSATILPTLIGLWYFHTFFRRRSDDARTADIAFAALALGTPIYGYATMLASHTTAAIAAFGAFMILSTLRETGRASSLGCCTAGALAAGVTWLEYQGLVASVLLTVFALSVFFTQRALKGVLLFAAGALLPTLSTMHFQYRAFGNAFSPGHLDLETKGFRTIHSQGFYGLTGIEPRALETLLVDLGNGLFPIAPFLALGAIGLFIALRNRATRLEAGYALAIVALTTLAISATTYWRGGWTIGPRYLVIAMPFLAFGAIAPLSTWARGERSWLAYGAATGLALVGLIASGLPSAYYPHLPPEFSRPLPQLFAPLIAQGYAPYNAANLIGLCSALSMVPLALIGLAALAYPLRGLAAGVLARTLACALVVACIGLAPLWIAPKDKPAVVKAVAFVKQRWSPNQDTCER
jgi:hypothetical protein